MGFGKSFEFWQQFQVLARVSGFGNSFRFWQEFRISASVSDFGKSFRFRHQFRVWDFRISNMMKAETFRHRANKFRHPTLVLSRDANGHGHNRL